MKPVSAITLSLALLLAIPVHARTTGGGRLGASAAKVDITPKESGLVISTDSIRDHLFARAIVFGAEVDASVERMRQPFLFVIVLLICRGLD